ncbi:hypothetical protein [Desulfobacca acetoxidans]|uniref:Uncharacterized protein n=1 Tax=Desulfobacca acetoxidans (strain ATCC 700848 / DSM 11109 / ASRB2) TaxID=880072 RepID=F2NJQ5_DESAR|nr:hypothetical protein [Desulfobacca acetoxidans]AEB09710.1 hypothetical protein Desac_1872 [Desulfobacca acetoxidans DSM 11109]
MLQYVDLDSIKYDFIRENREDIPAEFSAYSAMWEKSAEHFVDLFLSYLDRRGLEIRFKQPYI